MNDKIKYKLYKYGTKKFPSGDKMEYYPLYSIELSQMDLENILEDTSYPMHGDGYDDRKDLRDGIRKILEVK